MYRIMDKSSIYVYNTIHASKQPPMYLSQRKLLEATRGASFGSLVLRRKLGVDITCESAPVFPEMTLLSGGGGATRRFASWEP